MEATPKKVLMATDVPFWELRNGSHWRIHSLLLAMRRHGYEVSLFHLAAAGVRERRQVRSDYPDLHFHFMTIPILDDLGNRWNVFDRQARQNLQSTWPTHLSEGQSLEEFAEPTIASRFQKVVRKKKPDLVLIEYVSLAYLAKTVHALPERPRVMIDTHDVQSLRCEYFQNQGWPCWLRVNSEEEREALSLADGVIAIQSEDARLFQSWLPETRVLVAGHAWAGPMKEVSEADREFPTAGLIASSGRSNLEGVSWFFEKVWPLVVRRFPKAKFKLAGTIGELPQVEDWQKVPGIEVLGRIERPIDFYRQIDVAINPTHVPSGLKIKSVEAIGAGCCLVTNSVGAAGLESLVDRSIRVADDANGFANHLKTWFSDPASRVQAAQYALEYAREFVAEQRVYRELFDWMG